MHVALPRKENGKLKVTNWSPTIYLTTRIRQQLAIMVIQWWSCHETQNSHKNNRKEKKQKN